MMSFVLKEKEAAGHSIAELIEDGMIVGLGTGTTVAYAIVRLGHRIREEGITIAGVPTSHQSTILAIKNGIPITTLAEHDYLDIALDGADQVDADLNLLKGGGGAHTREKIVAQSARRFAIAVESSKLVQKLSLPVPLEVIPFGCALVLMEIKKLGGIPKLRVSDAYRLFITDNGNFIVDANFGLINDVNEVSKKLSGVSGIVEHGIFTHVSEVHVGRANESRVTVEILKR